MTDLDLAPIRERAAAAPSTRFRDHRIAGGSVSCGYCNRTFTFNMMRNDDGRPWVCDCRESRDAEFAAHARTDIPRLCDEIDRLRAELAAFREWMPEGMVPAPRSAFR